MSLTLFYAIVNNFWRAAKMVSGKNGGTSGSFNFAL